MHQMDMPPIVIAELTRSRLLPLASRSCEVFEESDILVEETPEVRPAVDQLERRCSPDKTDDVAKSDEASIVSLGDNVALVLAEEMLG